MASTTTRPFRFFDLPAELRNRIYALISRAAYIRPIDSTAFAAGLHDECPVLSLQLVNKQFRSEYEGEIGRRGTLKLYMNSRLETYHTRPHLAQPITWHFDNDLNEAPVLRLLLSRIRCLEINFNGAHISWACTDGDEYKDNIRMTHPQFDKLMGSLASVSRIQVNSRMALSSSVWKNYGWLDDLVHSYLSPVERMKDIKTTSQYVVRTQLYSLLEERDEISWRLSNANSITFYATRSDDPYAYEGLNLQVASVGIDNERFDVIWQRHEHDTGDGI